MSVGSATSACRCSGCWARKAQKQVSESVTVSNPAVSSTKQIASISSRVRRSPSDLDLKNIERMSSRGSAARSSRIASKNAYTS